MNIYTKEDVKKAMLKVANYYIKKYSMKEFKSIIAQEKNFKSNILLKQNGEEIRNSVKIDEYFGNPRITLRIYVNKKEQLFCVYYSENKKHETMRFGGMNVNGEHSLKMGIDLKKRIDLWLRKIHKLSKNI